MDTDQRPNLDDSGPKGVLGVEPSHRFRKAYLTSFAILTLLVVLIASGINYRTSLHFDEEPLINQAGRQRMLSQRITKAALLMTLSKNPTYVARAREELTQSMDEWTQASEHIADVISRMDLTDEQKRALDKHMNAIDAPAAAVILSARNLLARNPANPDAGVDEAIETLLHEERRYLMAMDNVVNELDNITQSYIEGLYAAHFAMAAILLAALAMMAVFVFEPTVRHMRDEHRLRNDAERAVLAQSSELAKALATSQQAEAKLRNQSAQFERAIADLEQFNRLAVGREHRMIELKAQVNSLAQRLGEAPPYPPNETPLSAEHEQTQSHIKGSIGDA